MKRITALLLLMGMLLSFVPAMAADMSIDFAGMSLMKDGGVELEATEKFEVKLNKPLLILEEITRMIEEDTPYQPFNIRMLVEGLFSMKGTATAREKISDNGNKISAYASFDTNMPLVFNKNLSADVDSSAAFWFEMNLKEKELEYIADLPLSSGKYLFVDEKLFSSLNVTEIFDIFSLLEKSCNPDTLEAYNTLINECIKNNAVISGNKNKFKIVFSDAGLKKFIIDLIGGYIKLFGQDAGFGADELNAEGFSDILLPLSIIRIFEDEALVIEGKTDNKGRITKLTYELNVALNLYNILAVAGIEEEGITAENSDIAFTVSGSTATSYKKVSISKPQLNPENTFDLSDMINATEPEYYEDEEYYNSWASIDADKNFALPENYIPLRILLEGFDYEVQYNNGVIKATNDSVFAEHKWFEVYMNSTAVIAADARFFMEKPIVNIGGTAYISRNDACKLMNAYIDYIGYYPVDGTFYISFERNKTEEDFKR